MASSDLISTKKTGEASPVAHDNASLEGHLFGDVTNASGHKQEVERNFSLINICGIAVTTGNSWTAVGGSVAIAIYNGGPPGVIYEFIAVSIFYWLIAASIAELASALPSSSGVYHWASVNAGRYGRVFGWFAGWWNFFAWIFGAASISSIVAQQTVAMYSLFHPDFVARSWHIFISYMICTWICCLIVLFGNKALPVLGDVGLFFILAGVFITIIVCAVMPTVNHKPYASNAGVWKNWTNQTGYSSNGLVFVLGMLNGAFAVGSTDCVAHLAEEIPNPSRNIPKAMAAQYVIGFTTAIVYMIAIFYSIHDLNEALSQVPAFPLAGLYFQASGTRGGALGLLIIAFMPTFITAIGCYITAGRTFWTLSRDNATPFSRLFGKIHPKFHNPFNATLLCGGICTIMGCIYVGSTTAFNAFVGSYIILSTLSYLTAVLPHLLNGRSKLRPGWFWMKGPVGFIVNAIACLYIAAFIVIFCLPYSLPVTAQNMNYSSLITGGLSLFITLFWFWRRGEYAAPQVEASGETEK
ncbi:hypothetical protein NLG97_g975 [Lecanicillium saksenae]|uniref:Uncharacterized protein n=1 Tax=Lecanicillium saksenae TaxID=468837 RepID=A0ACC1R7Q7_9HYPO|nr:hypothetical protein NLG97_g975 [Lecanicillium saksenae]